MNDSVYDDLVRLSLKREPTAEDSARIEAVLAAHPEFRERWEEDVAAASLLRVLPDIPLSSNFTSQVMEAIELDSRAAERAGVRPWVKFLQRFRFRLATAAVVIAGALGVTYQHHVMEERRAAVEAVRAISSDLAVLPNPEVLKDFEVINQIRQVSAGSDDDLLIALSK